MPLAGATQGAQCHRWGQRYLNPLEVHERPHNLLRIVDLRHMLQRTAPGAGRHHKGMPIVSDIGQFMVNGAVLTMTPVEYRTLCTGVGYLRIASCQGI